MERCGFAVGVQRQEGLRCLTLLGVGITGEMALSRVFRMNVSGRRRGAGQENREASA